MSTEGIIFLVIISVTVGALVAVHVESCRRRHTADDNEDCGGGHIWDEWESEGYWDVSRHLNDYGVDLVRVFEERKRYCKHEDCNEVDHDKTFIGYVQDFEDAIETPDELHERLGDDDE